jgi:hypothetical protein
MKEERRNDENEIVEKRNWNTKNIQSKRGMKRRGKMTGHLKQQKTI